MQRCFCPTGFELAAGSTTTCTGESCRCAHLLIESYCNPHIKILMSVFLSTPVIKFALIPWVLLCALVNLVMNFIVIQGHVQVSLYSTSDTNYPAAYMHASC